MAEQSKIIKITSYGEVALLLQEAAIEPVILERNGERYCLSKIVGEDIWVGYDPEKVRAAVRKTSGSWQDIDAEELIADIYRAREDGSRPASRP